MVLPKFSVKVALWGSLVISGPYQGTGAAAGGIWRFGVPDPLAPSQSLADGSTSYPKGESGVAGGV